MSNGSDAGLMATADLYATVSRKVLAWLPEQGVTDVWRLSDGDVSAAVVSLGGSYGPGRMRTVWTALRVLRRFLEESGRCEGPPPRTTTTNKPYSPSVANRSVTPRIWR